MWNHNGVAITLNDRTAKFCATKDGKVIESTSLAGIKKKLDEKNPFVSFNALYFRFDDYESVHVVGVKRNRAEWRGDEWVFSDGRTAHRIIDDTLENRALVQAYKKLHDKNSKLKEAMEKEERAFASKIVRRQPEKSK